MILKIVIYYKNSHEGGTIDIMGVDYTYAGSASYTRFDEEITAVAEILGGRLNSYYSGLLEAVDKYKLSNPNTFFPFGILNVTSKDRASDKYEFLSNFDPIVSDWLNHPYKIQSVEDTKHIWNIISKYPDIEFVSHQIWYELKNLVIHNHGWFIT